jgi:DNA polymerase III alpha subunit
VRVAGLVAAARKVRTRKGELMQFVTIEDEEGLLEATLFPRAFQAHAGLIRSLGPYVFTGKIEEDHRAINLNLAKVERWEGGGLEDTGEE